MKECATINNNPQPIDCLNNPRVRRPGAVGRWGGMGPRPSLRAAGCSRGTLKKHGGGLMVQGLAARARCSAGA